MIRGKSFYAIWDEENNRWSTDEFDVARLVDQEIFKYYKSCNAPGANIRLMADYSSGSWESFRKYVASVNNCYKQLDEHLTFADTETTRKDYSTKRLPYSIGKGPITNYEKLIGTLYDPEEREKIEWIIGAILSGDSRFIQKFAVFFGKAGSGKSTVLNLVQQLFEGYTATFEAKELVSSNNIFATEAFRTNPLVAIQHDGDLSRIEDNSKLNSIVSHEDMIMNEKYKSSYTSHVNCFLLMGTNKPVKITDAKSGIIRRLIDIRPSGRKIPYSDYMTYTANLKFELGAIAQHCLDAYRDRGPQYYELYRPILMMEQTDVFHNFVLDNYDIFVEQEFVTLMGAFELYKTYCDESLLEFKMPKHKFRDALKSYFKEFYPQKKVNGENIKNCFEGFRTELFISRLEPITLPKVLLMEDTESMLDTECSDCPAQYSNEDETPIKGWDYVTTTLKDIDTSKVHYVRVPENHIVIDFDIKDDKGNKCYEKNIEAASKWPETYSEISKGGNGVHLHYIYSGDVDTLSRIYDTDIEIKVFKGKSSLRRRFTRCHNAPIAILNSGLPLKGDKMLTKQGYEAITNEKAIRTIITKNLNKEYHGATRPSMDFIYKTLEEAYKSGINYDVKDLRPQILYFATNSSNQADYCIKLVGKMHFMSENNTEEFPEVAPASEDLVFFDVEVYPNLFVIVFKRQGKVPVRLINPMPAMIEPLLKLKLVGFNCRRYDNHILYARLMGFDNAELFSLSQRIIAGSKNAMFREAYNISYADIYDYSTVKQSLKKFEIALGIKHQEMDLPWDQPVPPELWDKVAEYCETDVYATEAVFDSRKEDFMARQIIAELSGLPVNSSTQSHTAKIIFGNEKNPQDHFEYTDLSEMFPGYKYEFGKSTYRDEVIGEGGYVYAEPGMYSDVITLDVESMHPKSIEELNLFGKYTKNFTDLRDARLAIKHKDYELASTMLGGILKPYLVDPDNAKKLSFALKIVINIVYGLTTASFENKFRDPRNKDNIVAKRGALFMVNLKHEVQKRGYTVAHIKTDSIKIPNADTEIINFVCDYGREYGYIFDVESNYEKFCLVNKAVYIAKEDSGWSATGEQFAQPYVFKTLFSKEQVCIPADVTEVKSVTSPAAMYLKMTEVTGIEDDYRFVGKVGAFCPMLPEARGGELLALRNGKYSAVEGTKGWKWLEESEVVMMKLCDQIDMQYYINQVDKAIATIGKYGDVEWFLADNKEPEELPFL